MALAHASFDSLALPDPAALAAAANFERVLQTYGAALERLAAAYEWNADDREDLLQDILFALWKALPGFRHDSSERTFVYRVAHNRALTHRSRSRRDTRTSLDEAAHVADPNADPAEDLDVHQRRRQLLDAIRVLPATHRQILLLRLEDLSNGEIAEVLGVNENVVAIRLTRARKALALELEGKVR